MEPTDPAKDWRRDFAVGDRYRCTITIAMAPGGTPSDVRVEWEPAMPRHLTDFELGEYVRNRDACLAEFQQQTGFAVAVVTI